MCSLNTPFYTICDTDARVNPAPPLADLWRRWAPRARWSLVALSASLAGCGYGLIRPDDARPLASIRVGRCAVSRGPGELAGWACGQLVRALSDGRPKGGEGPHLDGEVALIADEPVAFDGAGVGAMYRTRVQITLRLMDEAGGLLWAGPPQIAEGRYLRAEAPVQTLAARQRALELASRAAAAEAAAALEAAMPIPGVGGGS